jgi:hypothetical protein
MGTLTRRFEVENLSDLATYFEQKAKACEAQAERSRIQRDARDLGTEARTWEAAAKVVRETTITPPETTSQAPAER